jgi:hypothetical protein
LHYITEAEIDAVLEEQHKLRKLALERESEIKGRELPPTAGNPVSRK